MKECLWCKKQFQEKKDTAKYCSTSCRVMWNRKNPKKKNEVSAVQMQVLYNAILEKVEEMKASPQTFSIAPQMAEVPQIRQAQPKSYTYYHQAKIDCLTEEQWVALAQEIENDPILPRKQKNILLNNR